MKQSSPLMATETGERFSDPGRFPVKHASLGAEVLMRFLQHDQLTGLDAVNEASTTRLASVVHYLRKEYGWTILAAEKPVNCRDGRKALVVEYSLPHETIARAMALGAAEWCVKVRTARRMLLVKAATRVGAKPSCVDHKVRKNPDQPELFDGEPTE